MFSGEKLNLFSMRLRCIRSTMGLFKVLIAKVPRHKISRDRNVIINVVRKTINFISLLGSKLVTHSVDPSSSVTADTDNLLKALSLEQ